MCTASEAPPAEEGEGDKEAAMAVTTRHEHKSVFKIAALQDPMIARENVEVRFMIVMLPCWISHALLLKMNFASLRIVWEKSAPNSGGGLRSMATDEYDGGMEWRLVKIED